MILQEPLRTVTGSADAPVLQRLAGAEHDFTVAQLARLIPERSSSGIRLVLSRLVAQGIVDEVGVGRSQAFRLNRDHLAAAHIIALSALREELIDRLRDAIAEWPEHPLYAAMFGSAARGEMSSMSDIDLVFVRPAGASDAFDARVHDLVARAQRWTGNDVRPLLFDSDEVTARGAEEPVLLDIAREGVTIVGDVQTFRRSLR